MQRTHPLPRGATDLMGPLVVLAASAQTTSLSAIPPCAKVIGWPCYNPVPNLGVEENETCHIRN
jgi:hypothetical protein